MRWSVASGAVALSLRCALALDVSSNNKGLSETYATLLPISPLGHH